MMPHFWPMFRKEFIQMRRDRLTFAMMVGVPVLQLLVFGYAIQTDVRNLPAVVLDESRTPESREIIYAFQNTGNFRIVAYVDGRSALDRAIARGDAQAAIVVPYQYPRDLARGRTATLQIIVDASDPLASQAAIAAAGAVAQIRNLVILTHAAGRASLPLPGAILAKVPILSSALPERFPLFAWVGIAVIVSLFLAQTEGQMWRWAIVFLGLVTIAVALPSPPYRTPLITPSFFTDGTYRTYLRQGENDLVLPASVGDEMQWQEAADFWFRQSRGYIGPSHPQGQIGNPGGSIVYVDHSADVITPAPANFLVYLHQQEIASVILPAPAPAAWDELLTSLGAERIVTGSVTLYRAPSGGWPQTVP